MENLCTFVTGDAIGDYDKYVGKTRTDYECAALVIKQMPNANAATWGPGEKLKRDCYAEFGASTIGNTSECPSCHSCIFKGIMTWIDYDKKFSYDWIKEVFTRKLKYYFDLPIVYAFHFTEVPE